MTLLAKDLSPIHGIKPGDDNDRFLTSVQEQVRVSDHVIRLGETRGGDEDWVVRRDAYGTWQAGRYIGEIALGNRRLEIAPRYGPDVIGSWLEGALNLVAVPETSAQPYTESFVALLMAAVWCRAFDVAARHGPPALRRDQRDQGYFVRGHLDVRETARLRGRRSVATSDTREAHLTSHPSCDEKMPRTMSRARSSPRNGSCAGLSVMTAGRLPACGS